MTADDAQRERVAHGWVGRRPINHGKPPKFWVRACGRKGCPNQGILHAHAPQVRSEATVLARLAVETARADPWTAASTVFGIQPTPSPTRSP